MRRVIEEVSCGCKVQRRNGDCRLSGCTWQCTRSLKSASGPKADFIASSSCVIPRHKLIHLALSVAIDDGGERGGQIRKRIDVVELAGLNKRRDGGPILGSGIVSGGERILTIERYRPDCSLDAIVVNLDAAVSQEGAEAIPVFGDASPSGDLPETRAR